MATDFELLDAWRDGDERAGSELFRRNFDLVWRFFRNKDEAAAEDLIQKTFLAAVRSRDNFRKQSAFSTYLFAIARSVLYRHLSERARAVGRIEPELHSVAALVAQDPTASAVVAERDEQQLLLSALRHLPLDLQITLELYYWEDMSASQVAAVFEVPEGTVRGRLRRARQLLRDALLELSDDERLANSTFDDLEHWARSLRHLLDKLRT